MYVKINPLIGSVIQEGFQIVNKRKMTTSWLSYTFGNQKWGSRTACRHLRRQDGNMFCKGWAVGSDLLSAAAQLTGVWSCGHQKRGLMWYSPAEKPIKSATYRDKCFFPSVLFKTTRPVSILLHQDMQICFKFNLDNNAQVGCLNLGRVVY
jgi:hypothetical protein